MQISELSEFLEWMRTQPAYQEMFQTTTSPKELSFAHSLKISEELGELNEQLLGKFWLQRSDKADRFSDEKLALEMVDVIFATLMLAKELNIDMEIAFQHKIEMLKNRF